MKNFIFVVILLVSVVEIAECGRYLQHRRRCPEKCSKRVAFVCGTDGRAFLNMCVFKREQCKNSQLKLRNYGPCEEVYAIIEGSHFQPLCTADNENHSSKQFLDIHACITRKYKQVKWYGGYCDTKTPLRFPTKPKGLLDCPDVYDPVCGSDDETYSNQCVFDKQNYIFAGKLSVKWHGYCRSVYSVVVGLEEEFQLVCASDGNTYSSLVAVQIAKCQNYRLRVVSHGPCKERE
ncbi:four-domain proteases inhibitor-like [Clytia hemisphaerica]|uniref:Kazal-like domain-containing protein n=1 Tax=Clytia hemisphaerica TaxID=252671 RepID=A0A7M5V4G2_9CNID|eukprot:TCONS_00063047-protein